MILVIGGKGSIGRRYCANLEAMGEEYEVLDPGPTPEKPFDIPGGYYDSAIIASPTSTHGYWCKALATAGVKFLCEKPLAKSYTEATKIVDRVKELGGEGYVVNNWEFALGREHPEHAVWYDYYNTGQDGLYHDCCQLIHIATKYEVNLQLGNSSPIWTAMVDGRKINYQSLELSYGAMLDAFIMGDERALWTLDEGLEMVKDVLAYEASIRDSGKNSIN